MRIPILYCLLFVAVLLAAFWLRIADLNTMPPGLHYDEGENLQRSWRLIHGYGFLPNFEGIPEPFDAYLRAAFLSVVGVLPFTARLYHIFINLLGVAATIAAARALYWKHPQREAIALTAGMTLAALPPFTMIAREIYASNWIPFTTMMALAALVWAWRMFDRQGFIQFNNLTRSVRRQTLKRPAAEEPSPLKGLKSLIDNKTKHFIMAGFFVSLAITFYLSGLAFAGAFVLLVLLFAAYRRSRWPKGQQLAVMGISGFVTLIPWFTMFLWIPDWMTSRLAALTAPNLSDPAVLWPQMLSAIRPIFIPNTVRFPVYNPYTIAFLNPVLVGLFVVGLLVTVWRWRKPLSLAPLVIMGVMIVPNILSNVPEQPIRMSGIFGPLALLTGLGAGETLTIRLPALRRALSVALAAVLIVTPVITFTAVWYHYHGEPRLLDNPTSVNSWAFLYRQGYLDLMGQVADSTTPVYIPVEQLNSDLATVVLRPSRYPMVRAYDGRPLSAGRLLLPTASGTFGLPELEHIPLQYALALPDTREILILPPLSLAEAEALQQRSDADGGELRTSQGWVIGRTLAIGAIENPFAAARFDLGEAVAVFDNRLELLGVDVPHDLVPGSWIPITLYWRLREGRGQDYFVRLQAWDYNNASRGTQNDQDALIFRYLYPAVMWPVGEVVSETRWVQVFEDAPPGGYRFAVSVNTYPGPTPVGVAPSAGVTQDEWALVGRSAVSPSSFIIPDERPATALGARLDNMITLDGITLDPPLDDAQPGAKLHVRLHWQAIAPMAEGYTIFLHLVDASGNVVAQQDMPPFDGQYPTWAWAVGEPIVTQHTLDISADSAGPYTLRVGMYAYPSLQRLPVTVQGAPSPDDMVVIGGS